MDAVPARAARGAGAVRRAAGPGPQTQGTPLGRAPGHRREVAGPPVGAYRPGSGHLAVPGGHQSGCDPGVRRPDAVHAARAVDLAHAGVCQTQRVCHTRRLLPGNVGRTPAWRRRAGRVGAGASGGTGVERAGPGGVAARAVGRLVDQQASRAAGARAVRAPVDVPARSRPPDVALLRGAGQRGGKLAAPGQFPGGPRAHRRLAHLADQYRAGAAGRARGARFRLHLRRPIARADRQHHQGNGATGALPGPFLQLVRHAHARAAAAVLRLERRQRQPARGAVHPAGRAAGAETPEPRLRPHRHRSGRHPA